MANPECPKAVHPRNWNNNSEPTHRDTGISVRTWLVGQALKGLCR